MFLIYNAESGLFNSMAGWAHKLLSPKTYNCSLCRHTYGLTGMLVPWKTFLQRLPLKVTFLYRDQFEAVFPDLSDLAAPMILLAGHPLPPTILLGAEEIDRMDSLSGLIRQIQEMVPTEFALRKISSLMEKG